MTDKLNEQTDRGERASIALNILEETFETLQKDCFRDFCESKIEDKEIRKHCHAYMGALQDIKESLEYAVINGEAARKLKVV